MASKKLREDLISGLIGRGETEKEHRSGLYLFAATCLETSIEDVGLNTKLKVERKMNTLVPLKSTKDALALASAGELAIPYLANDSSYDPELKAACIQALANIGGAEALNTLEGYINDANLEDVPLIYRDNPISDALWHAWFSFDGEYRTAYITRVLSHLKNSSSSPLSVKFFASLNVLSNFHNLISLYLADCEYISSLTPLSSLTQLKQLYLLGCSQLSELSPLASLSQLTELLLTECSRLSNLSSLSSLTQLKQLYLLGCSQLSDLSSLASLTHLQVIQLTPCPLLSDLSPLSTLTQLEVLILENCPLLGDLKPLANLSNLKGVYLHGLPGRIAIPQALKGKVTQSK